MHPDLLMALVVILAITGASLFAILVGKASARVFFEASRRKVDEDEA